MIISPDKKMNQSISESNEIDERISALFTNAAAVRAVASAVENTLGPKGLDTMLVDAAGNIIVTNAGLTILESMEVSHPAARMLISIARNQHRQAGDGTTTATVIAAALINEGLNYVIRGVPVGKIIKGIDIGIEEALRMIDERKSVIHDVSDPMLRCAVLIAGRENEDIADSVLALASSVPEDELKSRIFRLSDRIISQTGMQSSVIDGLAFKKRRISELMPACVNNARILVIDDSLMPEEISESAMRTEAGYAAYHEYRESFRRNLSKIIDAGVNVVVSSKSIDRYAEEMFSSAGIMGISRLYGKSFKDLLDFTGAKPVRRSFLDLPSEKIASCLGSAASAEELEEYGYMCFKGGKGKKLSTYITGAPTDEIAGEKERIAMDAAASLQSALRSGVVAGGGALEISLVPSLRSIREETGDLCAYGIDCVAEALKRPMSQIVTNAGFNALEKIEQVLAAQKKEPGDWGIECDGGTLVDMKKIGVLDSAEIKMNAIRSAGEIARTILKINTIIKMRQIQQ